MSKIEEARLLSKPGLEVSEHSCLNRNALICIKTNVMPVLTGLCFGQLLAILLSGIQAFTQILQFNPPGPFLAPTTQIFLAYFLMGTIFTCGFAFCAAKFRIALIKRSYFYFIIAFFDVEAGFLVIKAYQYTNIISINILQSSVVVIASIISLIFLGARYNAYHFIGITLSLAGIVTILIVDLKVEDILDSLFKGNKKIFGDLLVLLASIFYAISNVCSEVMTKKFGIFEVLAFYSFFTSFISGIQLCFLERQELVNVNWNLELIGYLAAYVVCAFLFFCLMTIALRTTNATAVNMSLLSSNVYTILIGRFIFHYDVSLMYYIGICSIMLGLVVFYSKSVYYSNFTIFTYFKCYKFNLKLN